MLATLGAALGVVLAVLAVLGAIWRWVVLPNLREQLLIPVADSRRQLTENKHRNRQPTILDRLDDIENHIDLVALNQHAVLKRLGDHIGESEKDRDRLWLIVEGLAREENQRIGRTRRHVKERGDSGGP